MIDTHCHVYTKEFDEDIEAVMTRALDEGITRFYLPAIDAGCTKRMNTLEDKFPGHCFSMVGLHPCSVKENVEEELQHLKDLLNQRKFIGVGETGLDFFWDKTFIKEQYYALETQIELALQYNLPLILHTRKATQQTIDVIAKYKDTDLKGIFHCFGGSLAEAKQIIDLNFSLGIGGVLTYKNAGIAEVLEHVDMRYIVLETDAPYLAPVPMRGKRNESSYLKYVVEKLAFIKKISVEEAKEITSRNAEKIFGV